MSCKVQRDGGQAEMLEKHHDNMPYFGRSMVSSLIYTRRTSQIILSFLVSISKGQLDSWISCVSQRKTRHLYDLLVHLIRMLPSVILPTGRQGSFA